MHNNEVENYTKEQILSLSKFFVQAGIQVLACSNPAAGTGGIVAYVNIVKDGRLSETGLCLNYNIFPNSHEIPEENRFTYCFDPEGLDKLRECIDEDEWYPCNKQDCIGFVNFELSEIRYFILPPIKQALLHHPALFSKLQRVIRRKQNWDGMEQFTQFSMKQIPFYHDELRDFFAQYEFSREFESDEEANAYAEGVDDALKALGQPSLAELPDAMTYEDDDEDDMNNYDNEDLDSEGY